MKTARRTREPVGLAVSLAVVSFSFYALTGAGHSSNSDGYVSLMTARAIYREGQLAIDPVLGGGMRPGVDGRQYAIYAPAAALVMIPALVASDSLPEFLQPRAEGRMLDALGRDEFWMTFVNAALAAFVVALVFLCTHEVGASLRSALGIALSVAVGSPLWLYARIDGSEALQAVGLMGALAIFLRTRREASTTALAVAGSACALAIGTKLVNVVALPWFVFLASGTRDALSSRVRAVAAFSAPVLIAGAAIGWYNTVRFGGPFSTGYPLSGWAFGNPLADGAARLVLFPSYGLLAFWPAFAIAVLGIRAFARQHLSETIAICGIFATFILLSGRWVLWWGASWGPRFLVPAVPLLALFLVPLARRRAGVVAIVAATLIGAAVQSIAVATSYRFQVIPTWFELAPPNAPAAHRDASIAPLRIGHWWIRQTVDEQIGAGDRARDRLENPPWVDEFPWFRREGRGPSRLAPRRGLDLWLVPERWKLRPYDFFREPADAKPIPSDPPLAVLLALIGCAATVHLATRIFSCPIRRL